MLGLDEESFEDTVLDIVKLRAIRATRRIQADARRDGRNNMTLDEINSEIADSRK